MAKRYERQYRYSGTKKWYTTGVTFSTRKEALAGLNIPGGRYEYRAVLKDIKEFR